MRIVNLTKNTVLAENASLANTPFKKIKGLLGKKEINPGQALILEHCNSIHTFFMHFPIDILFVDKNNSIIKAIPSLNPYRLTATYIGARFAIELPSGIIPSTSTQEGDIISFT